MKQMHAVMRVLVNPFNLNILMIYNEHLDCDKLFMIQPSSNANTFLCARTDTPQHRIRTDTNAYTLLFSNYLFLVSVCYYYLKCLVWFWCQHANGGNYDWATQTQAHTGRHIQSVEMALNCCKSSRMRSHKEEKNIIVINFKASFEHKVTTSLYRSQI